MDTFFLSEAEAASCGWEDCMEKQKMRKSRAAHRVVAQMLSHCSSETSSSGLSDSCFKTCSLGSKSSALCYSTTSLLSAFDSSSAESRDVLVFCGPVPEDGSQTRTGLLRTGQDGTV